MGDLVSKFVIDSIEKLDRNEYEMSLSCICTAIDATATKEYKALTLGVGARYKKFILDNMRVIMKASMNISCGDFRFRDVFSNENATGSDEDTATISLADIIYKVRCSLQHELKMPLQLIFIEENKITVGEKSITLPISLVYGLLLAVVGAKMNIVNNTHSNLSINFKTKKVPLDSLWGQKKRIEQYLQED